MAAPGAASALTVSHTAIAATPATSALVGQLASFKVTVSGAGIPTPPGGSVDLSFAGPVTSTGHATLVAGVVTFFESSLPAGSYTVTAKYSGDSTYSSSTKSIPYTIKPDSTSIALAAAPAISVFHAPVTFTATVTANSPGGGIPSGTVRFYDATNSGPVVLLGSSPLDGAGKAKLVTSALPVENGYFYAFYLGTSNYLASSSVGSLLHHTIIKASTTSVVTANDVTTKKKGVTTSSFGDTVTFFDTVTANAPSTGVPGGFVDFEDNGVIISHQALVGGVASFTTSALTAGAHPITAVYEGSTDFNGSTSAKVVFTVKKAPAKFTYVAPALDVQTGVLQYSATLVGNAATTPGIPLVGEMVSFYAGTTLLCTATTDVTGTATCPPVTGGDFTTQLAEVIAAGGYTAKFAGNSSYAAVSGHGAVELNLP